MDACGRGCVRAWAESCASAQLQLSSRYLADLERDLPTLHNRWLAMLLPLLSRADESAAIPHGSSASQIDHILEVLSSKFGVLEEQRIDARLEFQQLVVDNDRLRAELHESSTRCHAVRARGCVAFVLVCCGQLACATTMRSSVQECC